MAQIKDYENQLENLVGAAIQSVADMIDAENNITSEQEQIETYYKIQYYLIDKWTKERHDRFINRKLKEAEEKTRDRIEKEPDFGRIGFTMTEQQTRIVHVLQELGYQTEACYEDGYEWVEYWKEGKRPEPDNGV